MTRYVIGFHAIEEYLKKKPEGAVLLAGIRNRRVDELCRLAESLGARVETVSESELDALPLSGHHRGLVLALAEAPKARYTHFEEFAEGSTGDSALVLALDGITDVHNLGAILRSADLFSVDAVILPARRAAKDGDVVAKISSGASAYVTLLEVTNLVRCLDALKEKKFWVYGADMKGSPASGTDLRGRTCLVLGSEGRGLSRLVEEHCDGLVRIPTNGHVDSFNVSVAAGLLMYEARRQQDFPGFNLR